MSEVLTVFNLCVLAAVTGPEAEQQQLRATPRKIFLAAGSRFDVCSGGRQTAQS